LIEDPDHREQIARLVRFSSTHEEDTVHRPHSVSLADYKARGGDACSAIWYLTAETAAQARTSPQLEAFRARDIEVLLMTDPIDAWVVGHLHEFEGVPLKSVSEGPPADGDGSDTESDDDETGGDDPRVQRVAASLGDRVSGVVLSRRLTDSPSCVVDPMGLDPRMRRMLEQAGQPVPSMPPKLEINPGHPLVELLGRLADDDERTTAIAELLLDEALLLEGGELEDPGAFVKRVNGLVQSAFSQSGDEGATAPSST
jgi:molecular chaperone HtpG